MGRRMALLLLVTLVVLPSCLGGGAEKGSDRQASPVRTPVVIDTDGGSDDIMAILYLLRRPDVDVRAITVSGTGLVHCAPGVRTVLGLLELAEASDVPVACGRETPLAGSNAFPEEWRATADGAYGLDLPLTARRAADTDAASIIALAVRGSPGPPTLVALGPLTNVAEAFAREHSLPGEVGAIVAMGGALLAPGNVEANPEAEWNFFVDPRAADLVLRSGAPLTLVPLDATNSVPITVFFVDALAGHHVTPEADAVRSLLERNSVLVQPGNYFWDPLAAVLAVGGSPATFERRRVVVLQGAPDVDGELVMTSGGVEVRVAMTADGLAFEREYLNTLNGDEGIAVTRPEPDLSVTVTETGCTVDGPRSLPAGRIAVAVGNPTSTPAVAALVALEGSRTYGDLAALLEESTGASGGEPPPWVEVVGVAESLPSQRTLVAWQAASGRLAIVCGLASNGRLSLAARLEVTE